ncbi:molecular chaperone [Klebsiella aerogenes]|uniref:molecular chaperone n=1 Tax=Klebsiella aerogenes TaxID=548 RepID=UPI0034D35532
MMAGVAMLWLFSSLAHAGVVIGGTRFVFGEKQSSISVALRNKSPEAYLVNARILTGGGWAGSDKPETPGAPFIATPPLFTLGGNRENTLRIVRTGGDLPADRESLFTLSVATIPSGKPGPNTVQMAVRASLKLYYRPAGLQGDPEQAYTQLKWSQAGGALTVENPTPYYVTLFQLKANDRVVDDAGMVAPFARRSVHWCDGHPSCRLQWQTLNDYGRVMAPVTVTVTGSQPVSAGGAPATPAPARTTKAEG